MKSRKFRIFTLIGIAALGYLPATNAAVTLVGLNTSTTTTTWITDGLLNQGGINYQNSVTGNFAFVSSGAQGSGSIDVEWPTAGTIDLTMGHAAGGTLRWTGATPSGGQQLVFQGIAPLDGYYAMVNPGDLSNTTVMAANKIFLTAGQIGTWRDSDPTNNEQYSFVQVDNTTNLLTTGIVGAWGASLVIPEPSSTALVGLSALGLAFRRRRN